MDGNRITDLAAPQFDNDAATKKYVDTSVSSSNTSVKEYADRAISGSLKEALVWENSSPGSTFGATTVTLSAANGLNIVSWKIEYYFISSNPATTIMQESRYDAAGHRVFAVNHTSGTASVVFRQCAQSGITFSFESAKLNGSESNAMTPVRIWAVYVV
jgi:hypothetical protein